LGFGIWDLGFGIWDLGFGIWDYLLSFDAACGGWDLGFNAKKKEGQILLKLVPLFSKLC
jgi:hypothetical protein